MGHVDQDGIIYLDETCNDIREALGKAFMKSAYYISGYPMNVVSIRNRLFELGIPPERVKMESFAGY